MVLSTVPTHLVLGHSLTVGSIIYKRGYTLEGTNMRVCGCRHSLLLESNTMLGVLLILLWYCPWYLFTVHCYPALLSLLSGLVDTITVTWSSVALLLILSLFGCRYIDPDLKSVMSLVLSLILSLILSLLPDTVFDTVYGSWYCLWSWYCLSLFGVLYQRSGSNYLLFILFHVAV